MFLCGPVLFSGDANRVYSPLFSESKEIITCTPNA